MFKTLLMKIVFCFLLQANATFMALAAIKEFADSWGEDGPFVWGFVENGTAVVRFHKALSFFFLP